MRAVTVAVVVGVLVLGACSGDDDSGDDAATTSSTRNPAADLQVVSLNILHGAACVPDSEKCQLDDRVGLFLDQLVDARCPEVVAVQEVSADITAALEDQLPEVCGGTYEVVAAGDQGLDRETVVTSLDVEGKEQVHLAGPLRTALRVRVRGPIGPVDIVVTHLASNDNPPCNPRTCEPPCEETGTDLRVCQARQAADLLERERTDDGIGLLVGDLNTPRGNPAIEQFDERGWIDSYLAAGNAECVPATGAGCSSGRVDSDLSDLSDPDSKQQERIDYIWVVPPDDCKPEYDPGDDADGDGVGTGLFAAEGKPGHQSGLVFPSDHTGTSLDLTCASS